MMVKVFPPLSSRFNLRLVCPDPSGSHMRRLGVNFSRVRASNDEYVPVHKSHHTDWVNESRYLDKVDLPTA